MSDPPRQIGIGSEPAPLPVLVAVSLVIVGALSGWFVHARIDATEPSDGRAGSEVTHPSNPDIYLVTLGNVGAAHLQTYRYERSTAPWLTDVARRSQVFMNASATSSWSLPSVASLMTGLLPSQHGLEEIPDASDTTIAVAGLSQTATTLAERLERVGYDAYAIVSNPLFLPETGLGRGFDVFNNLGFVRAWRVRAGVERFADSIQRSERPVFVWVHLSDAHAPYSSSSPMVNVWENLPYDPELDEGRTRLGPAEARAAREEARKARTARESVTRFGRMRMPELLALPELSAEGPSLDSLRTLYDGEVRTVDDHVQLLYGDLGIGDDDLVVIAGDHGEEFRSHGELGHGRNLHEDTVRVPLLVSWPAVWPSPHRHPERVSLVDLVPTLAALAGAPVGDGELPSARSFVPLLEGEPWTRDAPVISELRRADGSRCRTISDDAGKLHAGAAGEPAELYDLEADPNEQRDLAAERPDVVSDLVERLDQTLAALPVAAPVPTTAELAPHLAQQLRVLGYEAPPPTVCP